MLTNKVLAVLAVAAQILIFSTDTDAACKVPPELQGKDWVYEYTDVSTGETMTKTLSFGSTTIQQGISLEVQGSNVNAWTCLSDLTISDTESVAVFKSDITFDVFPVMGRRLYLCMRFTKVTDDLFYFHLMSDKNSLVTPKERVFSPLSEPDANADVCSTYCSYGDPKPMIRTLRKPDTTDKLPTDADLCENCGDSCIVSDIVQSSDFNYCNNNPCSNGVCENKVDGYTCSCASGYEGTSCDIKIDDCAPNPCLNGGDCSDGVDFFTCTCAAGYEGKICDRNIDDCDQDPCLNGGQCIDGVNLYTCNCAAGYEGKICDRIVCTVSGKVPFATGPTDGSYNYMDTITYSCIPGYEVQSGNIERSCQADGTWSGSTPVCEMTVDFFCETLLEKMFENKENSEKSSAESPEESSEIDTRGKSKANGKLKNWRKGRRCGYYKALEALILETCLLP
ncbi:Neurogenic locus notch homolog protein 1 [Mytilus edulis]|uniref:Neurogenic locus notch homolog protein 1 n=1 Tax=Mytilus edulis TaxID=6550 RepID=A0A8S3T8Z4_MYTED|nr:Neurogenic locus notch homolog protein 1 [Mytilus edulis]